MSNIRRLVAGVLILSALSLSACADLTPTQQRVGTGALGGAAGGALIGAVAGNAGLGAAIGAGVGAVGGLAWDQHVQSRDRAYQQGYAAGRTSSR